MGNLYQFELDSTQIIKFERWRKKQMKKDQRIPTAGERW